MNKSNKLRLQKVGLWAGTITTTFLAANNMAVFEDPSIIHPVSMGFGGVFGFLMVNDEEVSKENGVAPRQEL